jgi:hypothetical protein
MIKAIKCLEHQKETACKKRNVNMRFPQPCLLTRYTTMINTQLNILDRTRRKMLKQSHTNNTVDFAQNYIFYLNVFASKHIYFILVLRKFTNKNYKYAT